MELCAADVKRKMLRWIFHLQCHTVTVLEPFRRKTLYGGVNDLEQAEFALLGLIL